MRKEIVKDLHINEVEDFISEGGISIQIRENKDAKYYFVMNFTEEEKNIGIKGSYLNLISGKMMERLNLMKPYDVYVLKKNK